MADQEQDPLRQYRDEVWIDLGMREANAQEFKSRAHWQVVQELGFTDVEYRKEAALIAAVRLQGSTYSVADPGPDLVDLARTVEHYLRGGEQP